MSPDGLPPLREVIAAHGLAAKKSLGQNFILDLNLTRRIAREAAPLAGRTVVEIGPGPGGLTRALLLEGAARVVAIERDERCLPALAEIAAHYPGRLEVVQGDALEVDMAARIHGPALVVANLPYAVATMLLVGWLTSEPWPPWYESLTLMFQKEVAERIVAQPGSKSYGRLSVLAQWRTEAQIRMTLPPQAFTPPPKIDSAVIHLTPRRQPLPAGSSTVLGKLTAAAFGQRRKMLRVSLRQLVPDSEVLLADCRIAPTRRAEELSVAEFCRLADHLAKRPTVRAPHL
jgi:16S rRNA (adenine1518-N6/adenine1519-N6)-dimethyltransferase